MQAAGEMSAELMTCAFLHPRAAVLTSPRTYLASISSNPGTSGFQLGWMGDLRLRRLESIGRNLDAALLHESARRSLA